MTEARAGAIDRMVTAAVVVVGPAGFTPRDPLSGPESPTLPRESDAKAVKVEDRK